MDSPIVVVFFGAKIRVRVVLLYSGGISPTKLIDWLSLPEPKGVWAWRSSTHLRTRQKWHTPPHQCRSGTHLRMISAISQCHHYRSWYSHDKRQTIMGYTARHHTGVTRLQNAVASHRSCIFCCKIRVRVILFYAILNLTFFLGGISST